ncbi:general stress protein [Paenibacillus yonginensis]|uniref:General stress protein n=1 Tax=Paenibacillus yonginensis TaxID=1462996 RepID=A0A1B1N441_9BACL|nr:NAD(P)H-dependent oxidoreductase [Paenibacillus yonginensis]ANS76211.1 general stress protein [Paenibacillus yonginensis]
MKTLVIVGHPDLKTSRINSVWTEALKQQKDITVHVLSEVYPDGKINIAEEQALLDAHDRIILQYPIYWYATPPLLKQWLDEVFAYGWAFGPGGDHLKGKELGIAISTVGSAASYQPGGSNLFTIREIAKPMEATANYVSAFYLPPFAFHNTNHVTEEEIEASKEAYLHHLTHVRNVKSPEPITMAK